MTKIRNMRYEMAPGRNVKGLFFEDIEGVQYELFVEKYIGGDYRFRLVEEEDIDLMESKDIRKAADIAYTALRPFLMKENKQVVDCVTRQSKAISTICRRMDAIERRLGEPKCPTCGREN